MPRRITCLVLVAAIAFSGCGFGSAWIEAAKDDKPAPIFGGVIFDLSNMRADWSLPLYLIDLPISAVFDVLLLPLTISSNIAESNKGGDDD